MRRLSTACVAFLVSAACGKAEYPGPLFDPPSSQNAALNAVGSCDDFDEVVRKHVVQMMERSLEDAMQSAYNVDCGSFWDLFKTSTSDDDSFSANAEDSDAAEAYTTTNVQVGGVDEPDLVKNDGSTIYLISGGELIILAAWPANETHVIGRVAIAGAAQKLFIVGQRAVVYANEAIDCSSSTGQTSIHVFDLADMTAPRLVRSIRTEGEFVAARLVGDAVHTVLSHAFANPGGWQSYANVDACDSSADEITAAYRKLHEKNLVVIADETIDAHPPRIVSERVVDGVSQPDVELYTDCSNVYDPDYTGSLDMVTVISFSIEDDNEFSGTGIVGGSGEVYADADSLYVATTTAGSSQRNWWQSSSTVLHKFAISSDAAPAVYRASGALDGKLINQFAMDEHNDHLRVAVTQYHDLISNALYVLEENNGHLDVVGSVEGIAETEDIRSVRFDGDRGFIVTFKKTDPLYAFDLANPRHPRITGELHIPGFSTYMHLLDEQHLLTIGYDAADQGDFAWFTGVLLQIFDVSDMGNPRLTHKESIGTRGTSSDALDNHLAFTYFRERAQLAVPMAICTGGDANGGYGDTMTFNGLMVYDVSIADGFSLRGTVDHGTYGDCYNWWQSPDSAVARSIFMDDFVYSISGSALKVNDTRDFATSVSSVPLAGLPVDACSY